MRCSAAARSALARGDSIEQALAWAELASAIRPGEPSLAFNLACLQALGGHDVEAVAALQLAAKAGFKDATAAWREPAFGALRRAADFQSVLAGMMP